MIDDQLHLIARTSLVPMAERAVTISPMEQMLGRLHTALASSLMFPPVESVRTLFGNEVDDERSQAQKDANQWRGPTQPPPPTEEEPGLDFPFADMEGRSVEEQQAEKEERTTAGVAIADLPQMEGFRPLSEARMNQLMGDNGLDAAMQDQLRAMEALGYPLYEDQSSGAVTFYDPYLRQMRSWIDVASNYVGLPSDTAGGLEGMYQVADPDQMYKHEMLTELVEMGVITEESAAQLIGSFRLGERPFRGPTYKEGEVQQYFNSLGSNQLADLQGLLIRSGLASEDDLVMGVRDPKTRSLIYQVGDIASEAGITINEYLFDLVKAGGVKDGGPGSGFTIEPWRKPIYMEPDPAALREAVRRSFSQILLRDVQDYELKMFADHLNDDYWSKYLAEVEESKMDYNNRVAALNAGTDWDAGGTVQDVSPLERMADTMRERYADEIEVKEQVADRAADTQLVFRALGVAEGA